MRKSVLLLASMAVALLLASAITLVVPNEQARAAFPGINGKIAFQRDPDGSQGPLDSEIYTIWFNGNNLKHLTSNSKPDRAPSWSADGKKIVFERGENLYTMDANGTNQRRVPNSFGHNPAFSPNGRKIIFDAGDIYTINVDGTNLTQVTDHDHDPYRDYPTFSQPVWSPVSNKIAFLWSAWIYVVPLSDLMGETYMTDVPGDPRQVTPFGSSRPDWSPDGSQIAFNCGYDPCEADPIEPNRNLEIYKANANGTGTPTRLSNDPATDIFPAFSPGGGKIVFSSDRDGDYDLYITNADGTGEPRPLTGNSAEDFYPDWQPVQ